MPSTDSTSEPGHASHKITGLIGKTIRLTQRRPVRCDNDTDPSEMEFPLLDFLKHRITAPGAFYEDFGGTPAPAPSAATVCTALTTLAGDRVYSADICAEARVRAAQMSDRASATARSASGNWAQNRILEKIREVFDGPERAWPNGNSATLEALGRYAELFTSPTSPTGQGVRAALGANDWASLVTLLRGRAHANALYLPSNGALHITPGLRPFLMDVDDR